MAGPSFYKGRSETIRKQPCKYVIVSEGLTELQYMEGIIEYRNRLSINNPYLTITPLYREEQNADESDPKYNLQRIIEYRDLLKRRDISLEGTPVGIFVSKLVHEICKNYRKAIRLSCSQKDDYNFKRKQCQKELHDLQNDIIHKIKSKSELSDGTYIHDPDSALMFVRDFFIDTEYENYAKALDEPKFDIGYDPERDVLSLIID